MFSRHKKFATSAFILGSFLLALAACQDGPAEPAGASDKALGAAPRPVDPGEISEPIIDHQEMQARLAEMWAECDQTRYDTITGTIANPQAGGRISGTLPQWPGCVFKIEFAPGVLSGNQPRTFRMYVPQSYGRGVVYYQFEEVGGLREPFNGTAEVTIHWPAGLSRPKIDFRTNCLERSDADGDGVYEYSVSPGFLCRQPDFWSSQLTFRLPHFSRWPVQNGKVGRP